MNKPPIVEQRSIRKGAKAPNNLLPVIFLVALLAVASCSPGPAPVAERVQPSATSLPPTETSMPVSILATPAAPKPTATFVPLITPSPTPEGGTFSSLDVPRISIEVAKQMADAGEAVLVDVRTRATYEQAHIAGAISMPSSEVLDRYRELPTDQLIIFY